MNEFRGPKNGGRELWVGRKWPEMAGKIKNNPMSSESFIWHPKLCLYRARGRFQVKTEYSF